MALTVTSSIECTEKKEQKNWINSQIHASFSVSAECEAKRLGVYEHTHINNKEKKQDEKRSRKQQRLRSILTDAVCSVSRLRVWVRVQKQNKYWKMQHTQFERTLNVLRRRNQKEIIIIFSRPFSCLLCLACGRRWLYSSPNSVQPHFYIFSFFNIVFSSLLLLLRAVVSSRGCFGFGRFRLLLWFRYAHSHRIRAYTDMCVLGFACSSAADPGCIRNKFSHKSKLAEIKLRKVPRVAENAVRTCLRCDKNKSICSMQPEANANSSWFTRILKIIISNYSSPRLGPSRTFS